MHTFSGAPFYLGASQLLPGWNLMATADTLQLQLRFGPVPDWVQAQLSAATEDQLLGWVEGILTAQSLQDLMRPGPQAAANPGGKQK